MDAEPAPGTVLTVERFRIRPFKDQPRKHFDPVKLQELADSISAEGQRTPAEARRLEGDLLHDFELADGERRWRACALAGITTFRIWLNVYADADEQFISSVVANFGREDHTPIETARAIERILRTPRYAEGGKTERLTRVAKLFAKSPAWIYQHLSLLGLHPDVQAMLEPTAQEGQTLGSSMGTFLATVEDKELQLKIAREVAAKSLNLPQARLLARRMADATGAKIGRRPFQPSDATKSLRRFLDRLTGSSEGILELPDRSFHAAIGAMAKPERDLLLKQLDANVERLQQLREIIAKT